MAVPFASVIVEIAELLKLLVVFSLPRLDLCIRRDFVRHFRDPLQAVEATRAGATLVAENVGDFARWRSILASTKKTLKLCKPS